MPNCPKYTFNARMKCFHSWMCGTQMCEPHGDWQVNEAIFLGDRCRTASIGLFTSHSPRCFNCSDVDLLHRHHCIERTLRLTTASR